MQFLRSPSGRDLRLLLEVIGCVFATWLLVGWRIWQIEPIGQLDENWLVGPYVDSALHAGPWTEHLYRFGVIGGSKMHEFGGTPPLLDLCRIAGFSTTSTLVVQSMFVQVAFGFFGVLAIEGLTAKWGAPVTLDGPHRVIAIWICAFAPALGSHLAVGNANLLLGLLPWLAAVTLVWAKPPSPVALAFAAFAVWNGVSGMGSQTVIYSAVFGAPLLIASLAGAPRPSLRDLAPIAGALAAGVLLALPRVVVMIAHATGDDASRALGERVVYSYTPAAFSMSDLVGSLSWAAKSVTENQAVHHLHYPIGALLALFAVAPRNAAKLAAGLGVGLVLAVLFAIDASPISDALLAIPMLESFRVPARALLPVVAILPMLALACAWSARARRATGETIPHTWWWLSILGAIVAILVMRSLDARVREVLAWLIVAGVIATLRFAPERYVRWRLSLAFPAIAALSVAAFADRIPRGLAADRIEDGPAQLRAAVLAQAPELTLPLHRIEIVGAPPPFDTSAAFAARLPSISGIWYPPRRFLTLLGALHRKVLPPTTCVFSMHRSAGFPALQQLYNIRYVLAFGREGPELASQPPTPGPAWFVSRLERAQTADQIATAWRALPRPTEGLRTTGWVLDGDGPALATSPECDRARVLDVAVDEVGQRATFRVETPATCTLIVPTNYVSTFVATGDAGRLPVSPIDIALTGIEVPAGTTRVVLEPAVDVPGWAYLALFAGVILLGASGYVATRRTSV